MRAITASVGMNGKNHPKDVAMVQKLINENLYLIPNASKLLVDQRVGANTIRAIKSYQLNVVKMAIPDGRVDPHGHTFRKLLQNSHKPRPANVAAFVKQNLAAAKDVKAKYKIPVSVILAQAGLESGWGLSVKNNAYFGIKSHKTAGKTVSFKTTEYVNGKKTSTTDSFRAYANFKEAAEDYGKFLSSNKIYKPAFKYSSDPFKFVEKLQDAGYATDPNYANKLKAIISTYYLNEYDK
jgi:flagellar protein FlgJ